MLKPRIRRTSLAVAAPLTVATHQRLKGAAWERQRNAVLNRAFGMCECADCKATGRTLAAHEVDHVIPVWAGGSDDLSNLQAINRDCHARKTAREATQRAAAQSLVGASGCVSA